MVKCYMWEENWEWDPETGEEYSTGGSWILMSEEGPYTSNFGLTEYFYGDRDDVLYYTWKSDWGTVDLLLSYDYPGAPVRVEPSGYNFSLDDVDPSYGMANIICF